MQKLLPAMHSCADAIRAWIKEGRLLVIRFNDDCDGVVAGVELYLACKAYAEKSGMPAQNVAGVQLDSAVYSKKDSFFDLQRGRDASKKLAVVVCDLGANAESVEGLSALKEAGSGLCIIDHHPPSKDALALCDAYATSHAFDSTGAHTAGLVSFEVAKIIDAAAVRPEWIEWSLQSDKSTLFAGGDHDGARALDYLSHFSESSASAQHYYEKMSDTHTLELAARLARDYEKKALSKALRNSKQNPVGQHSVIVVCDVSKSMSKGDFPPKGRCLNLVQDHFCKANPGKAVVSLGISDDSISIRANQLAIERGFHSNPIISKLKEEFKAEIKSGGGHAAAASVRYDIGLRDLVRDSLLEQVKSVLEKEEKEN